MLSFRPFLLVLVLVSFFIIYSDGLKITATQQYDLGGSYAATCAAVGVDEMTDMIDTSVVDSEVVFSSGDGYLSMIHFSPLVKCPNKGYLAAIVFGQYLFQSSVPISGNCEVNVSYTPEDLKLRVHYKCKDIVDVFCLPACTFAFDNFPCENPFTTMYPYPYALPKPAFDTRGNPVVYTLQLCDIPCTHLPTAAPTVVPTRRPTVAPTEVPTQRPTRTPQPTALPTLLPTSEPSSNPTSTYPPTFVPTSTPTSVPLSSSPSAVPSSRPTESYYIRVPRPTSIPTSVPTSVPTSEPTSAPSSYPTQ